MRTTLFWLAFILVVWLVAVSGIIGIIFQFSAMAIVLLAPMAIASWRYNTTRPQKAEYRKTVVDKLWVIWLGSLLVAALSTWLCSWHFGQLRGAPLAEIYFRHFLLWLIVAVVVGLVINKTFADQWWTAAKDWRKRGGFWAVFSKSNTPGNTWAVLALIILVDALTYGLPLPDLDQTDYQLTKSAYEVITSGPASRALDAGKDAVNYLSECLVGKSVFDEQSVSSWASMADLPPSYQKTWWRVQLALLVVPFAALVFIWGRRNEMAGHLETFLGWFKSKRSSVVSATTDVAKKVVADGAGTSFRKLFASDFLSDSIVAAITSVSSFMRKF